MSGVEQQHDMVHVSSAGGALTFCLICKGAAHFHAAPAQLLAIALGLLGVAVLLHMPKAHHEQADRTISSLRIYKLKAADFTVQEE